MRYAVSSLRVFGSTVAAGGLYLWWRGGKILPITYRDVTIPFPLDLFLIVAGLLVTLNPLLLLEFVALFLGDKRRELLHKRILTLQGELIHLTDDLDTTSLARVVRKEFRRLNHRFYATLFVAGVFVLVGLPYLVSSLVSASHFSRESNRLVQLVQDTRIEFSSADHFREHLRDAESSVHAASSGATSTERIYAILNRLYTPSVTDAISFERAMTQIYEEQIKPHVITEVGVLRMEELHFPQSSRESHLARITLLTLLASICVQQGEHGRHVDPYLQARQLLRIALDDPIGRGERLTATHNDAGNTFTSLLRCYGQYQEKLQDPSTGDKVRSALGEVKALSRVSLARRATEDYKITAEQSLTNLGRARALNNSVDLALTLLHEIHLEGGLNNDDIRDEADRSFLTEQFAPPNLVTGWTPNMLISILNKSSSDLYTALHLSREPEIFFTRGQLYALAGALNDKYHFPDRFWGDPQVLGEAAVFELRTAASMQLQRRLFEEATAPQYYLDWLWKRPELRRSLEFVVRYEPRKERTNE